MLIWVVWVYFDYRIDWEVFAGSTDIDRVW
jgi:hypothetical protein